MQEHQGKRQKSEETNNLVDIPVEYRYDDQDHQSGNAQTGTNAMSNTVEDFLVQRERPGILGI